MIDASTKLYCILGNPVRHSFSPYMQNAAFLTSGINAVYTAFEVSDIEGAVKGIKAFGICGASVTIPHKISVMAFLDDLTDIARLIGSVNTIINNDGRLIGTNTDSYGFYKALNEKTDINGKKIALFGAGGAGKAICASLFYYGSPEKVYLLDIDKDRREGLEKHILTEFPKINKIVENKNIEAFDQENWDQIKDGIEIIIHATPMGMEPDINSSILEAGQIPENITVMDIVYNPHRTMLLKYAKERNCTIVHGIDMLLYQGIRQFELWTGLKAPEDAMRDALLKSINLFASAQGGK